MSFPALLFSPAERLIFGCLSSGLTLRQWYIVTYAEYLHTDPGLWRLTVDYFCFCGDIGKEMADKVLVRVPLQLQRLSRRDTDGAAGDDSAKIRAGDLAGVLKDVNTSCFEHQREGTRRAVCRVRTQPALHHKDLFSPAYPRRLPPKPSWTRKSSVSRWPMQPLQRTGPVSGASLTACSESTSHRVCSYRLRSPWLPSLTAPRGPANFARLVANIAPSLQTLRAQQESISSGVFVYRLMFAVRLAEFHQRRLSGELHEAAYDIVAMLRDDVAPKAWWAVVLSESVELLQNGVCWPPQFPVVSG